VVPRKIHPCVRECTHKIAIGDDLIKVRFAPLC
jgi:hypothetical protein